MALQPVVLDTDIISAVMREDPAVLSKALAYLVEHGRFTFSTITRYEILRGLEAKNERLFQRIKGLQVENWLK